MNKKDILKNLKYIYHRGFYDNYKIPENSLLAFEKCIKNNMPIELDLHILKDNKVIVFHDDNLKRMTGIDKKVKKCTYDEIKSYTLLDTNERIPTLLEVLDIVNGKVPIDIELKYDNTIWKLEKEVVNILDNYKGDFIIKSFDPLSLLYFRLFRKNYIRGQLVCNFTKKAKINHTIFNFFTKPDFFVYDYNTNKIKNKKDIPIFLFTINNHKMLNSYENKYTGFIIENMDIK